MDIKILLLIIIVIIIGIKMYLHCGCNKEYFSDKNIYIIIPCIPKHLKHLPQLFKSINSQNLKPTKVIVTLSDTNDNIHSENNYYKSIYQKYLNNIKLEFDCINIKQNAAENRNRGIYNLLSNNLNNDDYILFMDADDAMCKNKISKMIMLMDKYNADMGLHAFSLNNTCKNGNTIKNPDEMIDINNKCNQYIHIDCLNIHHGHITVKGNVIRNLKYDITNKYRRSEDSKFVRDVFKNNYRVVYTDDMLSKYFPDRSAEIN